MEETGGYAARWGLDRILPRDLYESLRPVRHGPGRPIVRSGDPARDLLFFVEGRAKAYSILENGRGILAAFYRPPEVLGELELFTSDTYALTVETLTDTVCLALPSATVRASVDRCGRLLAFLCERLGRKLGERAQAESVNLRYPVEARLASYLLAASDPEGRIVGTDDLGELADFIGASYRQLARGVRKFRDLGILDGARGRIRILDRARLEPRAGDRYDREGGGRT